MKKIICLVSFALLLVMLCPLCSYAEENPFDPEFVHAFFADYSIDDLLNMQKLVEIELEYRGYYAEAKEVTVPPGTYTIGADIPASVYSLSLKGGIISMITIKNADGSLNTMHAINASTPNIGKIDLKDGQIIEIVGEPVLFKPFEGLGF